jgi:cyclopropane fatty-acyl-phospholipid synthase-like methyltransferase
MSQDLFAHKAESFDQNKDHIDNVDNIAHAIASHIDLQKSMHIMDFGSGTGLLLERIAPRVGKITAVDTSAAMNSQLAEKRSRLNCDLDMVEIDLEKKDIDQAFDGIISSMTMHHIRDIDAMFSKFHRMLKPGGFIAIADLDKEDGSFHEEDTGVFHLGFEHESIARSARDAGFRDVEVTSASVVHKPERDFPVFLLSAYR